MGTEALTVVAGITGAWIIEFDGLCEPRNPGGRLGAGWVIDADGKLFEGCWQLAPGPKNTNNRAEWYALGFALLAATRLEHLPRPALLVVRGDSQLVINQLEGAWQCRNGHMLDCRKRCLQYIELINPGTWRAEWVPRAQNDRADAMSRRAYRDAAGVSPPERGGSARGAC